MQVVEYSAYGAQEPAVRERVSEILASRIQEHSGIKPTFFIAKGSCRVELALQKGYRRRRLSH